MGANRNVLVTGARGYLGGRLIAHLISRGFNVIGSSRRTRVKPISWPPEASLLKLDLSNSNNELLSELKRIDAVVHLSAANEVDSGLDPDKAVIDTGLATRRLLEFAVSAGVARFLFLSTVHVYGAPLIGDLRETDRVCPIHPYAISHMVGEHFVTSAHTAGRIQGLVVRLSNGIGAPAWPTIDRWKLLGNDLARQAVEHNELNLVAPGQWRDFIPLEDVCKGLEILLAAPNSRIGDGVFNLASGRTCQIVEIARLVQSAASEVLRQVPRLQEPTVEQIDVPRQFAVNIDRICSLGFQPSGVEALARELRATIQLVKQMKDGDLYQPLIRQQ